MKTLKPLTIFYDKLSTFGKILIFISLLLIVIVFLKSFTPIKEGLTGSKEFVFKQGNDVFDEFYANIYDYLIFSEVKNDYEIGTIINTTAPTQTSVIADIGCGTGRHVAKLSEKNLKVIGVDISPLMIKKAKENYPDASFKVGDALDKGLFKMQSLTHILCLHFTLYYFKDKRYFFDNAMDWLIPGGYLIVHIVDRETFDPILPTGNPLYIVSPNKYTKEGITKTKVTFNDFVYSSNFNLDKDNNIATIDEKFKFNDGHTRKQEQRLYMEDTTTIINIALECGFILKGKVDMANCDYDNQYIYILIKPS